MNSLQRNRLTLFAVCLTMLFTIGCGGGTNGTNGPAPGKSKDHNGSAEKNDGKAAPSDKGDDPVEGGWGNLTARFVCDGDPPKREKLNVDKDQMVCSKDHPLDESLIVNPDNKGIVNILVTLSLKSDEEPPEAHPSYEKSLKDKVTVDNKSCRFQPHVTLVRTGQTLVIKNSDAVGHNTKADLWANQSFNEQILAGGSIEKSIFEKRERNPIQISCGSHRWMTGWLIVQDHPYFAVSDGDGKLTIENLPTGKWKFQFRHPDSVYLSNTDVAGEKTSRKGVVEIAIRPGDNDLGEIKIPPAKLEQ